MLKPVGTCRLDCMQNHWIVPSMHKTQHLIVCNQMDLSDLCTGSVWRAARASSRGAG